MKARRSDYVSIHRVAKMFSVTTRTVKNWMVKRDEIFKGSVIRRNQTLYIGSAAISEFNEKFENLDL